MSSKDTIAAIATPVGRGGISVVRVSGILCREIAEGISGRVSDSRYATYVNFRDGRGEVLDQGLMIYFKSPGSFTGEDVLELQGHGSPVVMDMIIDRVLELGARLARPGEFSERAFLNNKIDLSQAEAIADLIDCQSREAAKSAVRSLQGEFSSLILGFKESLVHLRFYIEASIDFSEEEVDSLPEKKIAADLDALVDELEKIFLQARQGALLREGIKVVLAGRPNVGKSSLMNRLTGSDLAIVTSVPGTTRDVLREEIVIDGLAFQLVDTAGLRESADPVEEEGVKRAIREFQDADRILLLVDAETFDVDEVVKEIEDLGDLGVGIEKSGKLSLIINKIDLNTTLDTVDFEVENSPRIPCPMVRVSASSGAGITDLIDHLREVVGINQWSEGNFMARRRHLDALERTMSSLNTAREQVKIQCAGELIAEDLRRAQNALSEITGEYTSDDLLGKIFSTFCIGK